MLFDFNFFNPETRKNKKKVFYSITINSERELIQLNKEAIYTHFINVLIFEPLKLLKNYLI